MFKECEVKIHTSGIRVSLDILSCMGNGEAGHANAVISYLYKYSRLLSLSQLLPNKHLNGDLLTWRTQLQHNYASKPVVSNKHRFLNFSV